MQDANITRESLRWHGKRPRQSDLCEPCGSGWIFAAVIAATVLAIGAVLLVAVL